MGKSYEEGGQSGIHILGASTIEVKTEDSYKPLHSPYNIVCSILVWVTGQELVSNSNNNNTPETVEKQKMEAETCVIKMKLRPVVDSTSSHLNSRV